MIDISEPSRSIPRWLGVGVTEVHVAMYVSSSTAVLGVIVVSWRNHLGC